MKTISHFCLLLTLGFVSCGVRMSTTELIDEWGNSYQTNAMRGFHDKEIYSNNASDVWGLEKTACKDFSRIDTISYSGKSCLRIEWNKTGNCPWIGMGIGWNGYAAKDLTEVMIGGSIDFYIRAIEGKQYIPTLIFLLEDYSGIQTAALLKAKHLSSYPIDTNWQKVSIPLSSFLQAAPPLSDFSNIKSLNIECQGSGAFFVDQLEIGGVKASQVSTTKFGQTTTRNFPSLVYHDEFKDAWGLGSYKGRAVEIDTTIFFAGKNSLSLTWDESEMGNGNKKMGFSWEQWQAVDFEDTLSHYSMRFYVKEGMPGCVSQMKVGFESYNGKSVFLTLKPNHLKPAMGNPAWTEVNVPFTDFPFEANGFNYHKFKQFLLSLDGKGKLNIDEITIQKTTNNE